MIKFELFEKALEKLNGRPFSFGDYEYACSEFTKEAEFIVENPRDYTFNHSLKRFEDFLWIHNSSDFSMSDFFLIDWHEETIEVVKDPFDWARNCTGELIDEILGNYIADKVEPLVLSDAFQKRGDIYKSNK